MSDRLLDPIRRQIGNLLARGTLVAVDAARKMQSLQVRLLAGEIKDAVEHVEAYGYTSHPLPGAEVVAGFLDGDRSHGLVLLVADRRYRLTSLEPGEMAIHDDLGQKVHLTRSGIVIDGAGLAVTITNTPKVRMETALLEVTGDIEDRCDTTGKTMHGMRTTYNSHTHPETGSTTNQPNQAM